PRSYFLLLCFFLTVPPPTQISTLSLHDALPISGLFTVHPSLFEPSLCPPGKEACFCEQIAPYDLRNGGPQAWETAKQGYADVVRSEEHTSELQSRGHLVCRLLLEKKKNTRSKAE